LKTAVFAFGRMNPPTIGHKKLVDKVSSIAGDHFVFLSHASGNKTQKPGTKQYENKDPLPFSDKLAFVDVSFPTVTVGDSNVKTVMDAMKKLQADGYTDVIMVAGSDRVDSFTELLNKYQGTEYDFNTIEVVSAGERDPDAEGADGMSASKMRAAVRAGDFESFKQGAASPQIAKPMFDMLTKILKQNPMPGDAFNEEVLEMVTKKQIDDLEDQNHHSEVAELLAKHFGTDKEQKLVAKINALHSKRGHIERDEQIARDQVIKKYYSKVTESAEDKPYICVHAKKGEYECNATTSYGAAVKAAAHWKLKNTAGIDAHLAVEDGPDEEQKDRTRASTMDEGMDTHCSDKCCGSDITREDCTCSPTCDHCDCNSINESKEEFKPHTMYDKNGKAHDAKTEKQHLDMKAKGWSHDKPKKKIDEKQDSLMGVEDPVINISDLNGKPIDKLKMSVAAKKYQFNMKTIRPQFAHQDKVKHRQYTLSAPVNGQPIESKVAEILVKNPGRQDKVNYKTDKDLPNLRIKKKPSHFDKRKALASMVPKMQKVLSSVREMDLDKEQLRGVMQKAARLMVEIEIAQKRAVVENLHSLNKDDVMKSEVLVKGIGRYSVEGLMKNISEKLDDLSADSQSMSPFAYKNIKAKLDSGVVGIMLDSLVQAYDDLENARRKGGAASRSIPKNIFDDITLKELNLFKRKSDGPKQSTALAVLNNVMNRSDPKPFPIRMYDGEVVNVTPAVATKIVNLHDGSGKSTRDTIEKLLGTHNGFRELVKKVSKK